MANSTADIFCNTSRSLIIDDLLERFDDEDTPTLSSEEQVRSSDFHIKKL